MKLYLSSYKFGNHTDEFKKLMPKNNNKMGYIPNALDFTGADPIRKEQGIKKEMDELQSLGFEVELLDLQKYFGKSSELKRKLHTLGGVFVRGGNTFVLRQAMKLSGFDKHMNYLHKREDFLYSGYSAGVCVLAPTLKSLQIVDDPKDRPYKGLEKVIWDGLGILDYMILPHYQSDHPESEDIDKEIAYCKKNKISFKPLRDGEVIIIE
ncbi:MAG: Type 1 glutamine amidotransferase-like domain-containing protein [Candidatus Woesearchaeota archaeon]